MPNDEPLTISIKDLLARNAAEQAAVPDQEQPPPWDLPADENTDQEAGA